MLFFFSLCFSATQFQQSLGEKLLLIEQKTKSPFSPSVSQPPKKYSWA